MLVLLRGYCGFQGAAVGLVDGGIYPPVQGSVWAHIVAEDQCHLLPGSPFSRASPSQIRVLP